MNTQAGTVVIVRVRDTRTGVEPKIELGLPDKAGWNRHVSGWSIGGKSSGARIQIDEELAGHDLGIFAASNHVLVWGRVAHDHELPSIARCYEGAWSGDAPVENAMLDFRFDVWPLRIGHHEMTAQVVSRAGQ